MPFFCEVGRLKSMKVRCPAKINLSLDVTKKRSDGYHELEMIMQSIDIFDELEISYISGEGIKISSNEPSVPTGESNTAYKAAKLFFEKINKKQGVLIHIEKNIPQGAGLAGGSADAAGVLKALNELEDKPLSEEELLNIARNVGADVPFCVKGGTMLCCGIGEKMTPISSAKGVYALILKPFISVSTPWAYKALDKEKVWEHPKTERLVSALKEGDYSAFSKFGGNTLEAPVFKEYKEIEELKKAMLAKEAIFSLMTGSGACVYGIFESEKAAKAAFDAVKTKVEKHYIIRL